MKDKKTIIRREIQYLRNDNITHRIVFFVSAFFILNNTLYAGDAAQLDFIGFSEDGNYLAFEQYGFQDGSGFAYSEIILINVPENSFAYSAVNSYAENEDMTLSSTRDYAMMEARSKLAALLIVDGNTGEHVIHHPTSDIDAEPKYVRFYERSGGVPGLSGFREYALTLNEIEVILNDEVYGHGPPKMLELVVSTPGTNDIIVLQRDTNLPKRRSNVLSYRIQDVYMYHYAGNAYIAVFINYEMPGFEGPDMRFMVVTGKLDF
jgi:predicted secreted protein